MAYDPQKHHRRSIRLKGCDYTQPGAYFVTMVTYHREEIFGRIVNGKMVLSPLGKMIRDEWMRSIGIRKEIRLYEDEFVVMPNHVHAIVWIDDADVGADGIRPIDGGRPDQGARRASQPESAPPQRKPKSLGAFIAGFKSSVTSRARRELQMSAIWQRNYFEHIIRSDKEYGKTWEYIENNPQRWESDLLCPSAFPNQFNKRIS